MSFSTFLAYKKISELDLAVFLRQLKEASHLKLSVYLSGYLCEKVCQKNYFPIFNCWTYFNLPDVYFSTYVRTLFKTQLCHMVIISYWVNYFSFQASASLYVKWEWTIPRANENNGESICGDFWDNR
jgi:hypothetical protein